MLNCQRWRARLLCRIQAGLDADQGRTRSNWPIPLIDCVLAACCGELSLPPFTIWVMSRQESAGVETAIVAILHQDQFYNSLEFRACIAFRDWVPRERPVGGGR